MRKRLLALSVTALFAIILLMVCFAVFSINFHATSNNNSNLLDSKLLSSKSKLSNNNLPLNSPTEINSGDEFINIFLKSTSSVSGHYSLKSDISISYTPLTDKNAFTRQYTNGSFDGGNHKITITGDATYDYKKDFGTDIDSTEDINVGLLFGNLSGFNIRNLNIEYSANITVKYTVEGSSPNGKKDEPTRASYINVGLIAGAVNVGTELSNISITTSQESLLKVEGIDNRSGFSIIPRSGDWTYSDYKSPIDRSVGSNVGLIAGEVKNSFNLYMLNLSHSGLIWGQAHNKIAGESFVYQTKPALTKNYDANEASAAANSAILIGKSNSNINMNFVNLAGDGVVFSSLKALNDTIGVAHYKNDAAGGLVGESAPNSVFRGKGLYWNFTGEIISATGIGNDRHSALLFGGSGSNITQSTVKVHYFVRKPNNKATVSSFNTLNSNTWVNKSTASDFKTLSKAAAISSENKLFFPSTPGNSYMSYKGGIDYTLGNNEKFLSVKNDSTIINEATVEYKGFEMEAPKVGKFRLGVEITHSDYFLSAVKMTKNENPLYSSVYTLSVKSNDFLLNLEYNSIDEIQAYIKEVPTSIEIKIDDVLASDQTYESMYNGNNKSFKSTMYRNSTSLLWSQNIKWLFNHTPISSFTALEPFAAFAAQSISIPKHAGTYTGNLRKVNADNSLSNLVAGDVLGINRPENPSIVYTYQTSLDSNSTFALITNQKEVSIDNGPDPISRQYDGGKQLNAELEENKHYIIRGKVVSDIVKLIPTTAEFANPDVGQGKVINISGIKFNVPDYTTSTSTLTINNGIIRKRVLTRTYADMDGCTIVGDKPIFTYVGTHLVPSLLVGNKIGGEDVNFNITSHLSAQYGSSAIQAINVGSYYYKIDLAGTHKDNYTLSTNDMNGILYEIHSKSINVDWKVNGISINSSSYSDLIYDGNDQEHKVKIESDEIFAGDVNNLLVTYVFKKKSQVFETSFNEAGEYVVQASIKHKVGDKEYNNYKIIDGQEEAELKINKYTFTIEYHIANSIFSEIIYNGSNIKDIIKFRQKSTDTVNIDTLHITNNISLSYYKVEESVGEALISNNAIIKNVGNYKISPTYNNANNNYSLVKIDNEKLFSITPKNIDVTLKKDRFTYTGNDIKSKLIGNWNVEGVVSGDSVANLISFNTTATEIINVGPYLGRVRSNNVNYVARIKNTDTNEASIYIIPLVISEVYGDSEIPSFDIAPIADHEYTSNAIVPTLIINLKRGSNILRPLSLGNEYSLNYENNINVGEASVTVSGQGNFSGSLIVKFNITKIKLTVDYSSSSSSLIYSSLSHKSSIICNVNNEITSTPADIQLNFMYRRFNSTDSFTSIDDVIFAGDYQVVAVLSNNDNNNNYSLSNNIDDNKYIFSVSQKNIEVTFSDWIGLKYDKTPKIISCTFKAIDQVGQNDRNDTTKLKIDITYLNRNGIAVPETIEKGEYIARANLSGIHSFNYVLQGATEVRYNIAAREVNLSYNSHTPFVFDLVNKRDKITFETGEGDIISGDSISFSKVFEIKNSQGIYASVPNPINAGQYRMSVSSANSNYIVTTITRTYEFTIAKAEVTIEFKYANTILSDNVEIVYRSENIVFVAALMVVEGSENSVALNNDLSSIRINPQYYRKMEDNTQVRVVPPEYPKNAGNYFAEVGNSDFDSPNYTLTTSTVSKMNFIITKRPFDVVWLNATESPYKASTIEVQAIMSEVSGQSDSGRIVSDAENEIISISAFRFNVVDDYVGIDLSDIKNAGKYKVSVSLLNDNYKINNAGNKDKTFNILKHNIQFSPTSIGTIIKVYGSNEEEYYISHSVSFEGNITESLELVLDREQGNNTGFYKFTDVRNSNPNYIVSLIIDDNCGVKINKYEHILIPPIYQKTYGDVIEPDFSSTIRISLPNGTNLQIPITYEYDNNAIDASENGYDIIGFIWDKVLDENSQEVDNPDKNNVELIFKLENGKGKYIINPREINLLIEKTSVVFGEIVTAEILYSNMSIIDTEALGHTNANESSANKSNHVDLSVNLVSAEDLSSGRVHVGEYSIRIEMKNKNFKHKINLDTSNPKLEITKREIPIYAITGLNIKKVYDGKDVVNLGNYTYFPADIDIVAGRAGLRFDARFDNKNAGINKTVYIKYRVGSQNENDFILPDEYIYSSEGIITAKDINLRFNSDAKSIKYGETLDLNILDPDLVENETLDGLNVIITLYVEKDGQEIALNEVKNKGTYEVKLRVDSGNSNYNFNTDHTSVLIISEKEVTLVSNNIFVKYEDGTTKVEIDNENYFIDGLISEDIGKINIVGYTQSIPSSAPGQYEILVKGAKLDSLEENDESHENYKLTTTEFKIPAKILPIISNLRVSNSFTYLYDGTNKKIVFSYESIAPDAQLKVYYSNSVNEPINAGEYSVQIIVSRNNFTRDFGNINLIIKKARPNLILTGNFNQVYGSFTPITASANSIYGLNEIVSVRYTSIGGSEFESENPPAGEHTVVAKYEESENYLSTSLSKRLIISPANISVKFSGYDNLVYNAKDRKSDIMVDVNGVFENDVLDNTILYKSFEPERVVNAGEYTLTVKSNNANYIISGTTSLNFNIKKSELKVRVVLDDTVYSVKPKYKIIYEGFEGHDKPDDLDLEPILNIINSNMGENFVIPEGGIDKNYIFTFEKGSYDVVEEVKPTKSAVSKYVPYIVIGGMITSCIFVVLISVLAKRRIMRQALSKRK